MAPKSGMAAVLPSSSRYELLVRIASGGMATVYVGRLSGAVGFWRLVAVKRAHPHLLEDAAFAKMLVAEARLASKIHHPNVVSVQDVEELDGELLLIMDYVEGTSLSGLIAEVANAETSMPLAIAARIVVDACAGLHGAHQVTDEHGKPLGLVHRDVSPHNILVGTDGVARIADFGIAKVASSTGGGTTTGSLKGKVAYMAPEYVGRSHADVRTDVFALGIVAWEAFTQKRLFRGTNEIDTLRLVLATEVPAPSSEAPGIPSGLDDVVLTALQKDPELRFQNAQAFGNALETAARAAGQLASAADVGKFVNALVGPSLEKRREQIRAKVQPAPDSVPEGPRSGSGVVATDGDPFRTATIPVSSAQEHTEHMPAAPASQPSGDRQPQAFLAEGTTTGAAARSVEAVRSDVRPKKSRAWLPVVSVLLAASGIATVAALVPRLRHTMPGETAESTSTTTTMPVTSQAPPSSEPAAATQQATVVATPPSASADGPAAPRSSTATVAVAPPRGAPADGTKTAAPKPKPSASPAPRGDKAPPNPYGH